MLNRLNRLNSDILSVIINYLIKCRYCMIYDINRNTDKCDKCAFLKQENPNFCNICKYTNLNYGSYDYWVTLCNDCLSHEVCCVFHHFI